MLSLYKIIAANEEFYRNLLNYGTDFDIDKAFSQVNENLGEEINKKILEIFQENHNDRVYTAVVRYIGRFEITEAQGILLRELQKENSNDDYREEVIRSIGELRQKTSLEPLSALYYEKGTSLRLKQSIIEAFGKIEDNRVEELLIKLVEDAYQDTDLRANAIIALGNIRGRNSLPALRELLMNVYESKVLRMYAASSIGLIGGVDELETLGNFINDESHEVAGYAVNSIAKIPSDRSGELLVQALRSDHDNVRYYAVLGLSELQYKKAEDILRFKAQHDSNMRIRKEAAKALEKILDSDVKDEKNL
jgi:HEAT repeat protein